MIKTEAIQTYTSKGGFNKEKFKKNVKIHLEKYNPQIWESDETITVIIKGYPVTFDIQTGEFLSGPLDKGIYPIIDYKLYQTDGNELQVNENYDEIILTVKIINMPEFDNCTITLISKQENTEMIPEETVTGEGDKSYKITTNGDYIIKATGTKNDIEKTANKTAPITQIGVPDVDIEPNGGNFIMPSTGKATLQVIITSKKPTMEHVIYEYGWSKSETVQPTEWKKTTSIAKIAEKNTFEIGTYYLWIRVSDERGKLETKVTTSKPFTIHNPTIKLTPQITKPTKEDVIITANYDEEYITTYNATCTPGVENTDYTIDESKKQIIVKTNNQTVEAIEEDKMGNQVLVKYKVENIDKEPPTINSATIASEWTNTNKVITIKAQDTGISGIAGYAITTENTEPTEWAPSKETTWTSTEKYGNGTYYAWVKDAAENVSKPKQITIGNIEIAAPTITVSQNTTPQKEQTATIKIEDKDSGLVEGTYKIKYTWTTSQEEPKWSEINTTTDITVGAGAKEGTATISKNDGTGTYYLHAQGQKLKDKAGNESTPSAYGTFELDNTAPTVIYGTNGNTTYSKTQSTTVTVQDNGKSGIDDQNLKYIWTQNTQAPNESDFKNTFKNGEKITKSDGAGNNWYLWILAKDKLGNTIITRSNEFYIDNEAPSNTAPEATPTTNSITVTFMQTDKNSGINEETKQYSIKKTSDTTWGNWITDSNSTHTFTDLELDTEYYVRTQAKDNLGNGYTISAIRTIKTIDITRPTIDITPKSWTNKDVTVTITYQDITGITNQYSYDNKTWNKYTTPFTVDSNKTIYARSIDSTNQGSDATRVASYTITTIDKIKPTMNSITTEKKSPGVVKITGEATDAESGIVEYQFSTIENLTEESGGWAEITRTTSKISKTITATSNGTYYFYVKDAAGNINKNSILVEGVDGIAPTIIFETNGNTNWARSQSTKVTVTDEGSSGVDESSLKYQWKQSTVEPSESSFSSTFTNESSISKSGVTGNNWYLWVIAKDNAGNTTIQRSNAFYIDNTAPNTTSNPKAEVKNLSATGYDVYVYGITDEGSGVNRVEFTTTVNSTTATKTGTKQSDGTTWVYRVNTTDFGNTYGEYTTNINAYDNIENTRNITSLTANVPSVTVTFDPNGGTASFTTTTKGYGNTIGTLPTASRTGYSFNGWYTSTSGGNKISSSTSMPASNTTYYAQWTANTYTVYYDYAGATGGNSTSSKTVTYGSTYGTLPSPSKGYTVSYNYNGGSGPTSSSTSSFSFYGWYKESSHINQVTSSTTVTATSNHYLYAEWSSSNTSVTLPTPYSRSGYNFEGWYTSSSGGNKIGNSGSSYTPSSNITLYAHWKKSTVTLTFNANGGTASYPSKECTPGDSIGSLPTASRTNYIFDGWYTSSSGGSKIYSSTTVPSSNTTYYAHWTAANWKDSNSNYYATLSDATSSASNGSTITALRSSTESTQATISGKTLTIDPAGKTITRSSKISVSSGASLYVSGSGKFVSSDIAISSKGYLDISDATIKSTAAYTIYIASSYSTYIDSAKIINTYSGHGYSVYVEQNASGNLIVSGNSSTILEADGEDSNAIMYQGSASANINCHASAGAACIAINNNNSSASISITGGQYLSWGPHTTLWAGSGSSSTIIVYNSGNSIYIGNTSSNTSYNNTCVHIEGNTTLNLRNGWIASKNGHAINASQTSSNDIIIGSQYDTLSTAWPAVYAKLYSIVTDKSSSDVTIQNGALFSDKYYKPTHASDINLSIQRSGCRIANSDIKNNYNGFSLTKYYNESSSTVTIVNTGSYYRTKVTDT